jgi:aromatic-L-amino-acid decarboxylase
MSQVFGDQWSSVSGLYIISHNLRLAFCKQDSEFLLAALSNKPVFLRNEATDNNLVVDYKDWQIPLGRRFRALKLWMVMRLYGTSGLQSFIRNHVSSAKHFESLVRADSRFEVMAPMTFSLVCFRLRTLPGSQDNSNSLNSKLVDALNRKGNILVTHTVKLQTYFIGHKIRKT